MGRVAGVDGCPGGWIAVVEETGGGAISHRLAGTFEELTLSLGPCDAIAVDVPIGLLDSGPRLCDIAARRLLSPKRSSSVFPAPLRQMLKCSTYEESNVMRRSIEGKGVSKQSFAIISKIAEADVVIRSVGQPASRVFEVHPEVSFYGLAGHAMTCPKKRPIGREERRKHLGKVFALDTIEEVRKAYPRASVGHDDVLDAFVALWSARRIATGAAVRLPPTEQLDGEGLAAAIWY
jgi:predicted RNase H-like nuclease